MLDNPRSDRIRSVAALGGRSARKRSGRLVVEGPQAVTELLTHRQASVVDVYFTEDAAQRDARLFELAGSATRWVHLTTDEVAKAMSRDSQGVLAVASREAIAGGSVGGFVAGLGSVPYAVYLPEIRDPGNVGTMIRSADALGAAAVFVGPGTVEIGNPKVIRASAGSVFHLPIIATDFAELREQLPPAKWQFLGTSGDRGSLNLDSMIGAGMLPTERRGIVGHDLLREPHVWVFGNEARGLSSQDLAACDHLVRIPISRKAESLNVATAAAICLHASNLLCSQEGNPSHGED